MIYTGLNNTGEVEAIYGHLNGVKSEVSEVYGSIDYNDPIFYSRKTITGTSPLTFKGLGQPLKDYHIFGETVQNGTPSPDYPVDVQGVGEKTENLFDAEKIVNDSNNASTFIYGDYLRFGTGSKTMTINVNANSEGSYTISFDVFNATVGDNNIRFFVSYDDGTTEITPNFVISDTERHKYTFTTNNNKKLLSFETINTNSKVSYIVIDTAMLNLGSTALPHEPYGYKIPVTIGNVTTPIYIGAVQTTRKIRKLVLTGEETWTLQSINSYGIANIWAVLPAKYSNSQLGLSSHLVLQTTLIANTKTEGFYLTSTDVLYIRINATRASTAADFKSYLAAQYANGTPVTIWYVLATPETAVVNEPLHRIGDYADTISMTQAGASIPTVAGVNTLTVDTTVKPSAVSITGHIKPTGYGQLLDINDVDIQDRTGEPIYIQG